MAPKKLYKTTIIVWSPAADGDAHPQSSSFEEFCADIVHGGSYLETSETELVDLVEDNGPVNPSAREFFGLDTLETDT